MIKLKPGLRIFCSSLESVVIPDSVTSIAEYAFDGCSSLTSVTIPDSVTSIGNYAFLSCSSLTSIVIPDSVTSIGYEAFRGCSKLTSVVIPDSVTSVGYNAFLICYNIENLVTGNGLTSLDNLPITYALKSITIGSGINSITEKTFNSCNNLTVFNVDENNQNYSVSEDGKILFNKDKTTLITCSSAANDVKIPDSVTTVNSGAFVNCKNVETLVIGNGLTSLDNLPIASSLKSITIGNSIKSIGYNTFKGCNKLASVTIGNRVTSIDDNAFRDCSSLTSVTIPDSVTEIGNYAFSGCGNLTSVTIQNGVTSIGEDAFQSCSSLTKVTIPNSVTSIGECAFSDCSSLTSVYITDLTAWMNIKFEDSSSNPLCQGADLYLNGSLVTDLVIPDGVTSIGNDAFCGCSSLTSVTIGNSVTSIGNDAFSGCSSLESITIGNSVTSIGVRAFPGCSSLTSVTIPDSVTSIGYEAFYNCSSLESVHITDLTAWNNIEFENVTSNPLYYGANLYLNGSLAEFTVTFDAAGGVWNGEAVQTITFGEKVAEPTEPSKTGYVFYGWYTSTDAGQTLSSTAYNFDTAVKKDITLYAKWVDETVGYIAYSDGTISADYDSTKTPIGIVIEATDGTATKIVSLEETSAQWSTEDVDTNATSATDGVANMTAIQSISGWEEKYPAFKWCDDYTDDGADNSEWYLPAKDELDQLYSVKEAVNAAIEKITAGEGTATSLGTGWYWSSSHYDDNSAWNQRFSDGGQTWNYGLDNTLSVRAVRAF